MTPVVLLSDSFLANSAEPWRVVDPDDLPDLRRDEMPGAGDFAPYRRDPETLSRPWVVPGTPGCEHRIGGLEKEDVTGAVSYDAANHQRMVSLRTSEDRADCPRYSPGEGRGAGGGRSVGGRLGQHLRRDCRRRRRSAAGRATGRAPALALLESLPRQSGLDPRELPAHSGSGEQHGATPPHAPRPVPRGGRRAVAKWKAGRSASGRFRSKSNNCWENNRDDALRTGRLRCPACRRDAPAR